MNNGRRCLAQLVSAPLLYTADVFEDMGFDSRGNVPGYLHFELKRDAQTSLSKTSICSVRALRLHWFLVMHLLAVSAAWFLYGLCTALRQDCRNALFPMIDFYFAIYVP